MYSRCPKTQIWILFMALRELCLEDANNVGIGRESVEVCKGKILCSMERDLQRVARRSVWYGRRVVTTSWAFLLTAAGVLSFTTSNLLLQLTCLVYKARPELVDFLFVRIAQDRIVSLVSHVAYHCPAIRTEI